MCPDALHRELLKRLEFLEAAERQRRDQARRRARLLASGGKLCPVLAVLGLAGWAVGQGVEIKTSDGAADQQRFKVESGAATVNAYFMNAKVGIGTTGPGYPFHLQVDDGLTAGEHVLGVFRRTSAGGGAVLAYQANGAAVTASRVRSSQATDLRLGTGGNGDVMALLESNGNVGIGTISPDVRLTIASSTTTTDQVVKVYSQADTAIHLIADTDNVTETDNPYVLFSQDGDLVRTIIGYTGAANVDPQGGAYTGTANNDFLIGTITGGDILIGTGASVKATFFNTGAVHFTGGYANAAVAGAAGSAGFWFGDDQGAQTDPTFTISEDSNDTRCINFGVGSAVGVISVGAHDLYIKTGGTEGTINTGTSRIKIDDSDGSVEVTSLRGLTLSGGSTTNATFGAWPGNASANTWTYLSNGDTASPAYSDLAIGDFWLSGQVQNRFRCALNNGDSILIQPTAMANGDYTQIKFVDTDAGTGPMYLRYTDDGDTRLEVIGSNGGADGQNAVLRVINSAASYADCIALKQTGENGGTGSDFVEFRTNAGKVGDIDSNGAGTVNYNAFQGTHPSQTRRDMSGWRKGMIVRATGELMRNSPSQPMTELADLDEDPGVYGVFWDMDPDGDWVFGDEVLPMYKLLGLGHGQVLVTDLGGDIRVGDYVTSSRRAGYGRRQADRILRSHTVGKALEAVDWNDVPVDPKLGLKWKMIAIVLVCG